MPPDDDEKTKPEGDEGPAQRQPPPRADGGSDPRPANSRSKTSVSRSKTKKMSARKAGVKKGRTRRLSAEKTAAQGRKAKVAEVTVSHGTLVRRVKDARGTAFVVLAARAIGGALIAVLMAGCMMYLLSLVIPPIEWGPVFFILNVAGAVGLVFGANLASVKGMPEAAFDIDFLQDRVFDWVDPFRDEKPHLLPFWLEAILWAPTQVLAGAVPFLHLRKTGEADAEAGAALARRMVEDGEVELGESFQADSAEARGLRLLLLLRLVRLVIDDGGVKARVSGLGQTALFEGSVG